MVDTKTRIYIANLGKYNEGYLVGEWIDLPATEEELEALYVRIKVGHYDEDGEYVAGYQEGYSFYEEVAIHDYETDIDGLEIGEYDNIQELNELVESCEALHEWEYKKVCAIIEAHGEDLETAIDNVDSYNLYENVDDEEDLGRYCYENGFIDIPEYLERYFDFDAYGSDMAEYGVFTSYGFLVNC